ncbi:hypothetical protein [Streptomyces sp. NPDC048650]|uniref:hypothetical protein n=1 Tax=unclassified Streptomyces TaxID=2593676 RepID=UPI00371DE48F
MGTTTTDKRTDDETAPEADAARKTETETVSDENTAPQDTDPAETDGTTAERDEDSAADGSEDTGEAGRPAGIAAGAGAVVAAGLGLASVTGTWLGTTLAERANLLGQIKLQSGKAQAAEQISAVYGASWHTNALVNGVIALLAAITAAVVLTRHNATWVRAVAWGGLALGVLGILISAGMYLDLFASMPTVPKAPAGAGAGPSAP